MTASERPTGTSNTYHGITLVCPSLNSQIFCVKTFHLHYFPLFSSLFSPQFPPTRHMTYIYWWGGRLRIVSSLKSQWNTLLLRRRWGQRTGTVMIQHFAAQKQLVVLGLECWSFWSVAQSFDPGLPLPHLFDLLHHKAVQHTRLSALFHIHVTLWLVSVTLIDRVEVVCQPSHPESVARFLPRIVAIDRDFWFPTKGLLVFCSNVEQSSLNILETMNLHLDKMLTSMVSIRRSKIMTILCDI